MGLTWIGEPQKPARDLMKDPHPCVKNFSVDLLRVVESTKNCCIFIKAVITPMDRCIRNSWRVSRMVHFQHTDNFFLVKNFFSRWNNGVIGDDIVERNGRSSMEDLS